MYSSKLSYLFRGSVQLMFMLCCVDVSVVVVVPLSLGRDRGRCCSRRLVRTFESASLAPCTCPSPHPTSSLLCVATMDASRGSTTSAPPPLGRDNPNRTGRGGDAAVQHATNSEHHGTSTDADSRGRPDPPEARATNEGNISRQHRHIINQQKQKHYTIDEQEIYQHQNRDEQRNGTYHAVHTKYAAHTKFEIATSWNTFDINLTS